MNRKALNRRLWSLVRTLPGGEETMRDMVGQLRQRDGTGKSLLGTDEYTSTRKLTDGQFLRLLELVEEKGGWPRRRRSNEGNTVWLISDQEKKYIRFLRKALGFSDETFDGFVDKQTKGKGIRTHRAASAVIEPLERMLSDRGWMLTETKGHKWWERPTEE